MSKQIKLQYSTMPFKVPDFIFEGLKEYIADSNSYHPQPEYLINELVKKNKVSKEMVYLTAGAEDGIFLLGHTFGTNTYILILRLFPTKIHEYLEKLFIT